MSINHLMNIGQSALNAQQATIATTGNNIANVDTPGYSRQYVELEDAYALTGSPGAQGLGVDAVQVLRRFDQFVEVSFLDKSGEASRWEEQTQTMTSVESIFNESNRTGINDAMSAFFKAWEDLALRPDDPATRQNLITLADNLGLLMNQTMDDLDDIRHQMDLSIQVDVDRANELIESIADLNEQIMRNTIPNTSNPNDLLDKRDVAVRELATLLDIKTETTVDGEYVVRTSSGLPLVQGSQTFELAFLGPRAENNLLSTSTYEGEILFEGEDSYEYTVEMTNGGNVGDVPPPSYRVSLDGGKTWLRDTDGNIQEFQVTDTDGDGRIDPVQVHDLKISFGSSDPADPTLALQNFTEGDRFQIVPKTGIYFIEPTRGPQNITPQIDFSGIENQNRLTGGTLTSYFDVRDNHIGVYEDELNALNESMIWEINRLHSEGAGLDFQNFYAGTEYVDDTAIPLGTPQSGLNFYNRIESGTIQFHFYNADTGAYMEGVNLDFDAGTAGVQTFDPAVHSLQDVRDAINTTYAGQLTAEIIDGKLNLTSNAAGNPPLDFAIGEDTSGLMAALGINTFFQGTDATDIAVNGQLHTDHNRINAGYVNGDNELNPGDNALANNIGGLFTQDVNVYTPWRTTTDQSIVEYYSTLVSRVGADTRTAQTNYEYNQALADDLSNQQQAVSGVNLDEEMANLIKFQHAYTAAAKLITTADQMLETLLGLKQ